MSGIDFIADMTRAFRLGRDVVTGAKKGGDILSDMIGSASENHVQCSKSGACTDADGHEGGCTFAAPAAGV